MAIIGEMKKLTIGGSTYTIPEYSLPIASASTLGGVKIGTGLSINSTTGVLSATGLDFDEADPVFTASAAYGITSSDITNWNSKTSNTGTVTKVTAGTGLSIGSTAGGNFTTSGTINHTNSVTAQTTQAVYPIKIDAQGHISGYGTAVTSMPASDVSSWAKASAKPSYTFSEIGSKPTTLSGYGITDAYTKTQVDGLVAGVLHYKGTKASVANLPTTGNTTGDVWHITADGSEYAWDGTIWQELGTAIDLSGYAQLSGASFTGPVTFGDSVTADELNTGDLVVTGAASFTNNIQANTINGVAVGNSPKFTDTVTTVTTTGSGNAITAISATSGAITATKGTTFLTSHQTVSNKGATLAWGAETTVATIGSTDIKVSLPANPNTHNTAYLYAGASNGTANAATTNGNTYLILMDGGTATTRRKISGATNVSVASDSSGNITITGPNLSGYALSSAIPTKTSQLTNDSGFLTSHQTIYESKINWGNTGISGNVTPMGASLSSEHSANRIAYLNPAAIQIEYTTNGGSSWTNSGYSDAEKTWLCTGNQGIAIGQSKSGYSSSTALTTNHWTRITLTGQNGTNTYVYTAPRKLLVNMSTALGVECLVEYKTGASGASWQTFGTYPVSGWSGWNDIPLVLGTFGGGTNQTGNNWYLRFTFKVTSTRTDNYKGYAQVYGLRLFGANDWGSASVNNSKGPFSSTGHLYSYDVEANATFPAKVTATTLAGNLDWSYIQNKPTIPTSTNSNTTGITASTTATKTTLGTASSIYGVKSGTNSTTTASKASGSNGSASNWVFEDVACDDITAWSAGSGSASFTATVSSHVLSFSLSHTHTAPSLTYSGKTASHVKSGGNGTAPSWSFTDVTVPIRADSATSVPNVSVASATVSITDPGHTHTI